MNKTLLVLAAGMGSRYGGLKQLDSVGPSGETIIEYSLFDAVNAGFNDVVFIIRESFHKEFKKSIGAHIESKVTVSYIFQELNDLPEGFKSPETRDKPWGTGHALFCAIKKIKNPFLIINGDDFYGSDAFGKAAVVLDRYNPDELFAGMIGYSLANTLSDNGSVSRGICSIHSDNYLTNVIETHDIKKDENNSEIHSDNGQLSPESITSMNLWYFSHAVFPYVESYFKQFLNENINSLKTEFYLPTIVNNLINIEKLNIEVLPTSSKWYGVTYKEDKKSVCDSIAEMIKKGSYSGNLWEKK